MLNCVTWKRPLTCWSQKVKRNALRCLQRQGGHWTLCCMWRTSPCPGLVLFLLRPLRFDQCFHCMHAFSQRSILKKTTTKNRAGLFILANVFLRKLSCGQISYFSCWIYTYSRESFVELTITQLSTNDHVIETDHTYSLQLSNLSQELFKIMNKCCQHSSTAWHHRQTELY